MKSVETSVAESIEIQKVGRHLNKIIISALLFAIIVCSLYFYKFHGGMSDDQDHWNQFGGFLGGTLGPILNFLTLIALLLTLSLQIEQFKDSREQLANSKLELEEARKEAQSAKELQDMLLQAAKDQAEYTNTAARISALQAALSVASESLSQAQKAGALAGPPQVHLDLLRRKERLTNEILKLTENLFTPK
jgi:uncharacterized membrane protein